MINAQSIAIRFATPADSHAVGELVCRLLCELVPKKHSPEEQGELTETAQRLLSNENGFWAVLAFEENDAGESRPVALMTLAEGHALYAHGSLGEIMELYVDAGYRSSGLGNRMIDYAIDFGRERGWRILEVGAPDLPRWQRTVDFYKKCGFHEVGPRLDLEL